MGINFIVLKQGLVLGEIVDIIGEMVNYFLVSVIIFGYGFFCLKVNLMFGELMVGFQ